MGLRKMPARASWWTGYALSSAFKKPSHEERLQRLKDVQACKVGGAAMRDKLMKQLVRDGLVRLHRPSNAEFYKQPRGGFQKSTRAILTPAGEAFLADPTTHHVPKSERTEKAKGVRGK